jgi:hypothetical protein
VNNPKTIKFVFSILERLFIVNPFIIIQNDARIQLIIPIEIKISEVNQVTKIEKHSKSETSFLKLAFKLYVLIRTNIANNDIRIFGVIFFLFSLFYNLSKSGSSFKKIYFSFSKSIWQK